ncbi:membrane protein insertase YidC, partial [bacterium]|nr:membrane protein insertase YidC [bacterium]
ESYLREQLKSIKKELGEDVGNDVNYPVNSVYRPLNKEIDFVDDQKSFDEQTIEVRKHSGQTLVFTNRGGTIKQLLLRTPSGDQLSTVVAPVAQQREWRMFEVALDKATPYRYNMVGNKEVGDTQVISYTAKTNQAEIKKTYTVYKDSDKVDVKLELVASDSSNPVQARLLLNEPQPIANSRYRASFVQGLTTGFERKAITGKSSGTCWVEPTLFGLSGRYTVHAMTKDAQHFVKRAYHTFDNDGAMIAILEGPVVDKAAEWNMSFYLGPKEASRLTAVDPRLTSTLNYGWLGPVARPLFFVLKFFNGYTNNFGLAIILLTLLIRLLLAPFMPGDPGQAAKKQDEFKRRMTAVKRHFKDDPERLAIEQAQIAKEQFKSMGGGCLTMLFQAPVFIGLYTVLSNAIELYHVPFLWVSDLSARDPYYILPIIAGLCMGVQLAFGNKKATPAGRMTGIVMTVGLTALFTTLPAGVQLYMMVNSLFMLAQSKLRNMFRSSR